jgi:sensor c-di-GMP phosphodiesterase-like protein
MVELEDIVWGELAVTLVLMILVASGLAFLRFILKTVNKTSTNAAIQSIRKDPSVARSFAASLDLPYARKENFTPHHFEKLKAFIRSEKSIEGYRMMYVSAFDINHLIVFTELTFYELNVYTDEDGVETESKVKRIAYHNFVLKFDRKQHVLTVCSTVYSETLEKFQKDDFVREILKYR